MDKFFKGQRVLWLVGLTISFSFISTYNFKLVAQDSAEIELIKQTVRKYSGQIDLPLHVILTPKITEDLITTEQEQKETAEPLSLQMKFYEVIPAIYKVRDGKIVSETIELDKESRWLLCIGPKQKIYPLSGFSDPVSGFNDLMGDLQLSVTSAEMALSIFDMFLKLGCRLEKRESILSDEMKLQMLALSDFRDRYSSRERQFAYKRWWNEIPPKFRLGIVPPGVSRDNDGYKVHYYYYSRGNLIVEVLSVTSLGKVRIVSSKTLFSDPNVKRRNRN